MNMVLKEAGINDCQDVAAELCLSQTTWQRIRNFFGIQRWKAVFDNWQDQESCVSWDRLAEVLRKKYGIDLTQTILEISGGGRVDFCCILQ